MENKNIVPCPDCEKGRMEIVNSTSILKSSRTTQSAVFDNACLYHKICAEKLSKGAAQSVVYHCIVCKGNSFIEDDVVSHTCEPKHAEKDPSTNAGAQYFITKSLGKEIVLGTTVIDEVPRSSDIEEQTTKTSPAVSELPDLICVDSGAENLENEICSTQLPHLVRNRNGQGDNVFVQVKRKKVKHKIAANESLPAEYLCNLCKTRFPTSQLYSEHRCGHRLKSLNTRNLKTTICPLCQKECLSRRSLLQHIRSRHPKVTFICQICDKGFPKQFLLANHMRTHTGNYPYACQICGRSFAYSSQLWSHKRFVHMEYAFECETCGEKFPSRQACGNHIRIKHTKQRTLECEECKMTFLSSNVLYIHKRTHEEEKKYQCQLCNMTFRRGETLTKHMRIHSGEKPYSCPVCSQAFSQKNNVRRHCATQHPGLLDI